MANIVGSLGTIPTRTIGGYTSASPSTLIALLANPATTYSTMRAGFATSGYQVTTGKTFRVVSVYSVNRSATAGVFGIGYGDTDVGTSSASPPTNPVYINSSNAFQTKAIAGDIQDIAVKGDIPAAKYAFQYNNGDQPNTHGIWGYEE